MNWIEVKSDNPQKDTILVECIAEIRNNETGEIREYETHETLTIGDSQPSVFNWEEITIHVIVIGVCFLREQITKKEKKIGMLNVQMVSFLLI